MFYRIFASALLAGLLAGAFGALLQQATTVPLIVAAEAFESPAAGHDHDAADHAHDEGGWMPADGAERILFTALSTVLIACGYALLLVAIVALSGRRIDGRTGILWGLAGFAATALAPALGLPPELPGTMAADVGARQVWWVATALATGIGLWLLAFSGHTLLRVAGVVVLVSPHLVGAPHPDSFGGPVPPELAAHFVAASLVTAAAFWVVLGWLAGLFFNRFGRQA